MDKWAVSGQVAVIILDSIKRNITKAYRGERQQLHGPCSELLPGLLGGVGEDSSKRPGSSWDRHPAKHFSGPSD